MPCRHLSKVRNCVGWKRQKACRIMNPSRSPHISFPNERELLKILTVLSMESTEAEKSFSCIQRIHNWLRNTMTIERLSDLAVIAVHAKAVTVGRSVVCEKFVALHPRRLTASSLLADQVSKVFLLASISSAEDRTQCQPVSTVLTVSNSQFQYILRGRQARGAV